jgi:predicted nuclease of predicted toxin-antitoxin system
LTKLLADENVPLKAVEILREKGVDAASVTELSPGLKDREVLDLAGREGRIIATFNRGLRRAGGQREGESKGA